MALSLKGRQNRCVKLIQRCEDYYGRSIESPRIAKISITKINKIAQKYILSGNVNFYYDLEIALARAFQGVKV